MNSNGNVSIGVNLSVSAETAKLLLQMASDMEISIDDVLSSIAEDAVIDLTTVNQGLDFVVIPDKCSKQDLINAID